MAWGAIAAAAAGVIGGAKASSKATKGSRRAMKIAGKRYRQAEDIMSGQRDDTVNKLTDFAGQQAQDYAGYGGAYDQAFNSLYQQALQRAASAPQAPSIGDAPALNTMGVRDALDNYGDYIGAGKNALAAQMDMLGLGDGGYDFRATPGYDWRRGEALRGVEGSAAARGGLYSGGTMRALQEVGDHLADAEYDRVYGRLGGVAGQGLNAVGGQATGENQLLGTEADYLKNAYNTQAQFLANTYGTNSGNWRAGLDAGNQLASQYLTTQGNRLLNSQGYAHNAALQPIIVDDAYGQQLANMKMALGDIQAGAWMGQAANQGKLYGNMSNNLFQLAGTLYGNQTQQPPATNNITTGEWDWMNGSMPDTGWSGWGMG